MQLNQKNKLKKYLVLQRFLSTYINLQESYIVLL